MKVMIEMVGSTNSMPRNQYPNKSTESMFKTIKRKLNKIQFATNIQISNFQ